MGFLHKQEGFPLVSYMWLFWLLLIFCSSRPFADAKCKFPAIFNFGDSNSDTGGFWAAFPAQHGPFGMTYFKKPAGRASDGRLVIDFLAQALGLPFLSPYLNSIGSDFRHGANFATLASTVLLPNTSLFVTGISPFSLAIQLNQIKDLKAKVLAPKPYGLMSSLANFIQHQAEPAHGPGNCHSSRDNNKLAFKLFKNTMPTSWGNLPHPNMFGEALYTIDIGQNDFTSNLKAIGIEGVKQYLPQVASQIAWTIKELYDMGGRTFMVLNLAPIGCFPAFLMELPHNSSDLDEYGCMISYNNAVVDYNNMLNDTLHQLLDMLQDASVIYMDTHSVKLELSRHPKDHGLLYGTKACCGHGGGAYNFDPEVYCGNSKVINGSNVTATACEDPQNYASWDGIHGTEAANKLITRAVLSNSYSHPPFPLSELCDLHSIG